MLTLVSCVIAIRDLETRAIGELLISIPLSTKCMPVCAYTALVYRYVLTLADQSQEAARARFARHWPNYSEDMWSDRLQIIKSVSSLYCEPTLTTAACGGHSFLRSKNGPWLSVTSDPWTQRGILEPLTL